MQVRGEIPRLNRELLGILSGLRQVGVTGTLGGAVKCVDIKGTPVAKAATGPVLTLRRESVGSERD